MTPAFAVALQDERASQPTLQLAQARERGAEVRDLRAALLAGELTLADVLEPVHPAVTGLSLIDVVRLTRASSRRRSAPGLENLGCAALRDGVNLLVRSGRASSASRAWVIEHGSKGRLVR